MYMASVLSCSRAMVYYKALGSAESLFTLQPNGKCHKMAAPPETTMRCEGIFLSLVELGAYLPLILGKRGLLSFV